MNNTVWRSTISSGNVKLLAQVFRTLAKVGDECFVEFAPQALVLRTLNSSKSAFVAFHIGPTFFEAEPECTSATPTRCKVILKSCLAVFRSVSTVERCALALDDTECRLTFELQCRMGIRKTYKVAYEACEAMQAIYDRDKIPHRIVARPKYLHDALQNFHPNIEEITMQPHAHGLRLRSYLDEAKAAQGRYLHTEMQLARSDLDEFALNESEPLGELTFCLKEAKAVLAFGEQAAQLVSVYFDRPGRPILFTVNFHDSLLADFVLATLMDTTSSSQATPSASRSSAHSVDASSAAPHAHHHAQAASGSRAPSASPQQQAQAQRQHYYAQPPITTTSGGAARIASSMSNAAAAAPTSSYNLAQSSAGSHVPPSSSASPSPHAIIARPTSTGLVRPPSSSSSSLAALNDVDMDAATPVLGVGAQGFDANTSAMASSNVAAVPPPVLWARPGSAVSSQSALAAAAAAAAAAATAAAAAALPGGVVPQRRTPRTLGSTSVWVSRDSDSEGDDDTAEDEQRAARRAEAAVAVVGRATMTVDGIPL